MSERINQHLHPLVGSNIRRLRKEQGLKATEVIAKLQCDGINVTTGIFSKGEWFSCLLLFCHIKGELPILFFEICYFLQCCPVVDFA